MTVTGKNSMLSLCIVLSFISFVLLLGPLFINAYAQNKDGSSSAIEPTTKSKNVNVDVNLNDLKIKDVAGSIGSLQTDNKSKIWVTSGKWDLQSNPTDSKANSSSVKFNATIDTRGVDNSQPHTHKISDFKLIKTSIDSGDEGSVLSFNGTANIQTPSGLHTGVPISIKLMDSGQILLSADAQSGVVEPKWIPKGGVMSLMIDQKIQDHFGNSPIYGTIRKQ